MGDDSEKDLREAMRHVGYELWMTGVTAGRMRRMRDAEGAVDSIIWNAYTEAMLVHARALADFLVVSKKGYPSDIRRTDFAPEWTPRPADAAERIEGKVESINKHLAHLTWERVEVGDQWPFLFEIAADILAVADAWSAHLNQTQPELNVGVLRPHLLWANQGLAGSAEQPEPPPYEP